MFDFHLHSSLSFDSDCPPRDIVLAAEKLGLYEICFTDHYDYNDIPTEEHQPFSLDDFSRLYDNLFSDKLKVRKGVEFGLTPWNQKELFELTAARDLDFVIGSIHYVGGHDPYNKEFWEVNGIDTGFQKYLEQTLECVKKHDGFDVLGHLTYVSKSDHSPTHEPLLYEDYSEICDEIMKVLVSKGKGMEINTSGVIKVGDFLPSKPFIKRFRELGGEIVTVGSDSHNTERVGQYIGGALDILRDTFGYVCTFENRKPIFHKL